MSEPTLKQLLEDPCTWTDYSCECIAGMALERIEELEATGWISVEDRLPERMDNYDVWLSGDNMYKPRRMADVVYSKEHGAWLSIMAMGVHPYADQITHWMPLPEPPKESE